MRGDNEDNEQSVHNETEARQSPETTRGGRQSDSNVERTLGHVEPTMGGIVTFGALSQGLTLSDYSKTANTLNNPPLPCDTPSSQLDMPQIGRAHV